MVEAVGCAFLVRAPSEAYPYFRWVFKDRQQEAPDGLLSVTSVRCRLCTDATPDQEQE